MYEKIENRDQLLVGSLVRNVINQQEVLEIESYDSEKDYYELFVAGSAAPQTGGKGDSLTFGSSFENLAKNYEVEIVDGGFRNEGEA